MRRIVLSVLVASASACTLFTSFEDLAASDDVAAAGDAGEDAPEERHDAEGSRDSEPLDAGCMRRPSSASNATPDGSDGVTCGVTHVLALDGLVVGFDDIKSSPHYVPLAGETVKSCVRVEFEEDIGRRIVVHAMPVDGVCGGFCTTNPGDCATKTPIMKVFAGAPGESLQYLDAIMFLPDAGMQAYEVTRAPGSGVRVVVVCQAPRPTYDLSDLGVDYVEADCP